MNKKWLIVAGVSIVLLVLFYTYQKYQVAPTIKFSQLQLVDLNNQKAELGNTGSSQIITFGASWCSSCIRELNDLKKISSTTLKNVNIIVISDEETDVIEQFRDRKQYPFTFLKMMGKFSELGINSIPTTYIVDKDGEIKKESVGYIHWDDPSTVSHLLHLLQ